MKRIALMTSGGDAPGMNAAVRAVVRRAIYHNVEPFGIYAGYKGLMAGNLKKLSARDVSNVIQRGGTILKTSRAPEFETEVGRSRAVEQLRKFDIDGLIVIGGDGSLHGAQELERIWDGGIVGLPGTIDNDLSGTDFTIGYDTAVNTALEAIDKIRDTADSHDRYFVIEVMGRLAGFIALEVAIGGGAEYVLVPELDSDVEQLSLHLEDWEKRGKTSCIIVVAEGEQEGGAEGISKLLREHTKRDFRVVVLGHMQRGGVPTASDRVLATQLGSYAVDALCAGQTGVMAGIVNGHLTLTPFAQTWENKKPLDKYLLDIIPSLSV